MTIMLLLLLPPPPQTWWQQQWELISLLIRLRHDNGDGDGDNSGSTTGDSKQAGGASGNSNSKWAAEVVATPLLPPPMAMVHVLLYHFDQFDTALWLWHDGSIRHFDTSSLWPWQSENFNTPQASKFSLIEFSDELGQLGAVRARIDQKAQNTPKLYVLEPNLPTSSCVTRWIYLTLAAVTCDNDWFLTEHRGLWCVTVRLIEMVQ
jgi:hypothetical protein